MLIGFLTLRSAQEAEYATELARRAPDYGLQVVRFTPAQIQPVTELIAGLAFDQSSQEWKQQTFPLPSIIYDRCFYNGSEAAKKGRPIVDWLKKRTDITFLGYGLPDKWETYRILSSHRETAPYVPHTEQATADQVHSMLARKGEAALKPINGSQGNGFCRLSHKRDGFYISMQQGQEQQSYTFRSKEELTDWLSALFQTRAFLLQPHLSVQDRHGRPFDIRILLQKDEQGQWQESGRGVRVGAARALVSNLHAGSSTISYAEWRAAYPRRDLSLLEDDIRTLIAAVPRALERELPPLFEVGLDISVERNRAVWLLDVNSKPGRKVITTCMPERTEQLYRAPLAYSRYLMHEKGADVR
ncbi:YheC/YheD family endospore coat-associated protein [Ectobacillus ponti]|uniref:YheC/YheD family protein n=1 Tax=Ectobacillus ponti TaxID=2961894 RepID=A0AA41X3U6_9BACI|nr:YheC/YheD family protein [Ectobacillus ponti]MCP8968177.1 YheC/YheD family protein [Ectobacillus ponti]